MKSQDLIPAGSHEPAKVATLPARASVSSAYTFSDLERMAVAVAASKLFGVKTKEEALSLMLLAQAEGRHPAIAARDYHIIEGRPALKADAMLARFQEAGGRVKWVTLTDELVSGEFTAPDGTAATIAWSMKTAQVAGLADRPTWKRYARAMLRSRVASEGIRTVMPGVIVGTYTPEELRDGDVLDDREVEPTRPALDHAPEVVEPEPEAAPVAAAPEPEGMPSGLSEGEIAEHLAAIRAATAMHPLQKAHSAAYKAAYDIGDILALKAFDAAKAEVKKALLKPAAE